MNGRRIRAGAHAASVERRCGGWGEEGVCGTQRNSACSAKVSAIICLPRRFHTTTKIPAWLFMRSRIGNEAPGQPIAYDSSMQGSGGLAG